MKTRLYATPAVKGLNLIHLHDMMFDPITRNDGDCTLCECLDLQKSLKLLITN